MIFIGAVIFWILIIFIILYLIDICDMRKLTHKSPMKLYNV